jgi:phosphate-selective porin OprO and OprP
VKHIYFILAGVSLLAVPGVTLADDGFTLKPRGRVLLDFADIDYNLAGLNTRNSDSEFRTARFGIQGKMGGRIKYVAEFDFQNAGSIEFHDPKAKDVKLSYKVDSNTSITLGNQKTPNSMEEQTSGRFTTFLERGTVTDAFRLSRRFGVVFKTHGDNYTFAAGAFGNDLNAALYKHESLLSNEHSYAARATYTPLNKDGKILHLGGSVRRFSGNAGDQIRIRARPRIHLSQRLVDAKNQGKNSTLYGLEAAYVSGPFHIEGEWMREDALQGSDGYFVQTGWFLTGETRNYSAKKGAFGRLKPAHAVGDNGGMGAFEIAARFDTLDLSSANAGKQNTWTTGLNWYPQSHVRVMLNAIHATARGAAKFGRGKTDGVQMRLQYDW